MAGFSKLGNMAKAKQCVDFFWRVGRTAIATVLKTVDRKVLGVRISHSPPKTRNCKVIWITLLTENQCDAQWFRYSRWFKSTKWTCVLIFLFFNFQTHGPTQQIWKFFIIRKIVKYKCGHVGQWSTPPLCLRGITASSNLVMSAIQMLTAIYANGNS